MQEVWKDILNYEGIYQVSNFGNIRNLDYYVTEVNGKSRFRKGRIITKKLPKGAHYYQVILFNNKKSKLWRIHRLVALTFIPNPNNLPEVNHKDFNKLNNFVDNLEWCDKSFNMKHSIRRSDGQFGENRYNSKLTNQQVIEIKKLLKTVSCAEIAKQYNVNRTTIQNIKSGLTWS